MDRCFKLHISQFSCKSMRKCYVDMLNILRDKDEEACVENVATGAGTVSSKVLKWLRNLYWSLLIYIHLEQVLGYDLFQNLSKIYFKSIYRVKRNYRQSRNLWRVIHVLNGTNYFSSKCKHRLALKITNQHLFGDIFRAQTFFF